MYTNYLTQSRHLAEAGLLTEALTPLNVGLALYPNEPALWLAKYQLLRRLNTEEAWQALVECRRIAPDYLAGLVAYYEELLRQGRIREAYHTLLQILEKDPENPRWWVHKAFWALNLGQNEEAEAALQKASELPQQSPQVRFYQALFLARLGKNEEASALLQKCLQEEPSLRLEADEEPVLQVLLAK